MFSKLALRNVRRSFRDYGVYLLTLTFGVCLFYTFNSIDGQGVMVYLAQSQNPMAQLIQTILDIFSVFVAVVLACLILYANTFLIRRRKRELGTYLLLGLSQRQVSGLLVLETLVIGLISLAAGLLLGLAASQGLSALTLSMFSIRVDAFALAFSPRAAVRTVGYFGLIFLLVMVFSGIQVSRARLIDLMQGERKNEELRERPLGLAVVQFVLGAVCLAAAYAILLTFGMAIAVAVLPICAAMLFLGTLGTLLIFKSLSGFVVKLVQSRPGLYFRGLNLFTLRQWLSRVHSTYLSMTVICILLLLAVGITASSIGLNSTLEAAADEEAPFDLTVQNQSADSAGLVDFPAVLAEGGFDLDRLGEQLDVLFYYNDPAVTGVEEVSAAIRLSDYNALLAHGGRGSCHEEVPMVPDDPERRAVTGGLSLSYAVVPDELAGQLEVRRQVWFVDYAGGDEERTEAELIQLIRPLDLDYALQILALFLGLYLGFTFLLAAAAVLALQQLSQAADNQKRYAMLRRLGADDGLIARSASQQVALAFLMPLGLALIHSMVGMKAANDIIATAGEVDSVGSSLATAAVLILVYGGYFLATALACRRMARQSWTKLE